MRTDSYEAARTPLRPARSAAPGDDAAALTLMFCAICDLVGGPFPPQEAAHLHAVHDRLHHGVIAAA